MALTVHGPPARAGDVRVEGLIPESGRSLEKREATHSSVLAWRPTDRGAWLATVHGGAKGQMQLKRLSTHAHTG